MCTKLNAVLVVIASLLAASSVRGAELITFQLTGTVTYLGDAANHLGGAVEVGDEFAVTLTYDLETEPVIGDPPSYATYPHPDGGLGKLDVSVSGLNFMTDSDFFVRVFNDYGSYDEILARGYCPAPAFLPEDFDRNIVAVRFRDETATTLSSLSLPTELSMEGWSDTVLVVRLENAYHDMITISGPIEDAQVVPTPPSLLIRALIDEVRRVNEANGIESNSLDAKLNNSLDALMAENADQRSDVVNKIESFINAVAAQSGKKISVEEADYLIAKALVIIDVMQ